jgi:carboxymethylenebutenolidase
MCFDADSHPPIAPMAGAAIDSATLELRAADGNRLAALRADAAEPTGAAILVLPDVRGLFTYYEELALRFAEAGVDALAIDYYGRTAGASRRDASFDFQPHTGRTTWAGLQADVRAAAAELRGRRDVRALFSIGFCFGGRLSFLLATLPDLQMGGAVGFYGWPVGAGRNDMPAPADEVARFAAPVLGIFGGADQGIPATDVATFESALATTSVEHRIVTYDGAPHSFFDRKQEQFAEASAAAWAETLAFIRAHTPG